MQKRSGFRMAKVIEAVVADLNRSSGVDRLHQTRQPKTLARLAAPPLGAMNPAAIDTGAMGAIKVSASDKTYWHSPLSRRFRYEAGAPIANIDVDSTSRAAHFHIPPKVPRLSLRGTCGGIRI